MKNTWRFGESELRYIREVIDSGFGSGTSGSMNNRFEAALAEKVGARYAVTFNSGTSTLHAALDAVALRYQRQRPQRPRNRQRKPYDAPIPLKQR